MQPRDPDYSLFLTSFFQVSVKLRLPHVCLPLYLSLAWGEATLEGFPSFPQMPKYLCESPAQLSSGRAGQDRVPGHEAGPALAQGVDDPGLGTPLDIPSSPTVPIPPLHHQERALGCPAAGQKDTRSVYGDQHRCQPGWCSDGREFLKLWDQSCSSGFASWDLGQGAISAAGRRWYLGLVTVRCPKMPSPGPDFSFRLSVHSPALTHLSGGQYASHGDVWVSLEAGAGLMLGQPWRCRVVWGFLAALG
ncbi:uncharacterized protein LOC128912473 [Rissa tridactyla]|uniref:uncharacterized protein LOC128912473 n=1 Tax=Rissa tridactyla TaxID=75485 RepID=UPI0023BB0396|nr:uncharacterized protein LOC128912473 [Rissa tridactyla]